MKIFHVYLPQKYKTLCVQYVSLVFIMMLNQICCCIDMYHRPLSNSSSINVVMHDVDKVDGNDLSL